MLCNIQYYDGTMKQELPLVYYHLAPLERGIAVSLPSPTASVAPASEKARRLYPFTRHHLFNSDPTSLVHVILQQHMTRARLLKVALNHTWLDSILVTPTIPFDSSHGFSDFHYSQGWRISSEETQVGTSALFRY